MKFNWKEFISSDNIAVHCATKEQAIDFCKQMHEHVLEWFLGESYLLEKRFGIYKKNTCYTSRGTFASENYCKSNNYTILEWSNYEKEKILELTSLTDEQKQQIIELAKKFEQENEVDKLDYDNDYIAINGALDFPKKFELTDCEFKDQFFDLGLTAHTKEDAEKIRRRLLVEKELRDWAKKCKDPVDWENTSQEKYYVQYETDCRIISIDSFYTYAVANILFTDKSILEQAIESIGQERLIRDYFGIE